MNRSILIVICDFLLVSLVAFSNFEALNDVEEQKPAAPTAAPPTPGAGSSRQDLVSAMKQALDDERRNREDLARELARSRETSQGQNSQLQAIQENLRRTELQARQLAQERSNLQLQIAAAQTNLQSLQGALSSSSSEAGLARQQLELLQSQLRQREADIQTTRQRMGELEKTAQAASAEKQTLHARLQVAETEKRLTGEQLAVARNEIQTVRAEKAQIQATTAKLADGVSSLAEKSGQLTQEIRENRALAPNSIFHDIITNRVQARFESVRAGIFNQDVKKDRDAQTILITDGSQIYAVFHVADTPLSLWPPGTEWRGFNGIISRAFYSFPIEKLTFLTQDPRIVAVPVDPAQAKQLGARVYRVAPEPFKFPEAVLVGATEGYYGEIKFQIDLSTPQYVRMDRNAFRGLIGKFNPSRGDLVLSKTGEVLGLMVNNEYCAVFGKIAPGVTLQAGDNLKAQQTSQALTQLQNKVVGLPQKLQ